MRYLIVLISIMSISYVRADFVDIATVSVNGNIVRKLTNNSKNTYLINFDRFKIGDTVKVKIWTDHGGERNAIVTLQNLESNETDTLERSNKFILTKEILENEHLISVIYFFERGTEEFSITWNIFKVVPNNRIELVYERINELRDLLIAVNVKKVNISESLLGDSIFVNFDLLKTKGGDIIRSNKEAFVCDRATFNHRLQLDQLEISYIQRFNSIDYLQLYDLSSEIHGGILIDENSIDNFNFSFGNFDDSLTFYFSFRDGLYKIDRLEYSVR